MKTLGIISEFNPFHNGHKYLLDKAKKELKADLAISIMSGDFVQRGEAAIMDKFSRASVAVKCGFDLVIEIPSFVTLQSAEFFAKKSVNILNKINIDYLVFGIENINTDDFLKACKVIIENEKNIDSKIKSLIASGLSYPKSHNKALLDFVSSDFLSSNNILALEYMRALYKINSKIKPYPINRIKTKNEDQSIIDKNFASSTAIRNNLDNDIKSLIPIESYIELSNFMNEYKSFDYDYIYKIFKYKILIEDYPMCKILGYEQGIDNYLARLARDNNLYNNFIDQATSQRYTKSRIKRLVLNYILDNTMELNNLDLSFVKVLAYNNKATENFNNLANKLNIVINKSDLKKLKITDLLVFNKMIEASNFYNLGIGREIDYDFRHNNRPI
ncbi:nucleotidyltransferase family protein [Anaerococcus murdochii]|uniref:tRNA(Met) cytidine acetate ligase n=1 Tax=Anaerococcus murdochii TaxID=411577 RepID=A0ABS7T147_9FIRM|nr:nucleotidyltransferase family protein [Anaerococcus murdochii]MBZ2387505.1 nucleotidyltransferase family protein [Anaerococcus murdochii]